MRIVAALVLLALSNQTLAQGLEDNANAPVVYRVEHGELNLGTLSNGNADVVYVGPGVYMSDAAATMVAKRLEGDKAEIASLKASLHATPPPATSTWVVIAAVTLGILAGSGLVLTLKR
jgi:hypothetical protein